MTTAIYETSPTKRPRRSKAGITEIEAVILEVLQEDNPMTVRQIYYQLVSRGAIDKTEAEYKTTVCRLLGKMRKQRAIPYDWIADNTRWMRKPRTYDNLLDMLETTKRTYRRAVWNNQDAYVEIWLEKDALAGVVHEITSTWDVPLMVTRGYPSLSFLYGAAETIRDINKDTFIYYFGDRDPSGVNIPQVTEKRLIEMLGYHADRVNFSFEVMAVTPEQIEELELPTRPTKKSDSRSRTFEGESVELDAIPAETLREMVRGCIKQHVNFDELEQMLKIEEAERKTLEGIAKRMKRKSA